MEGPEIAGPPVWLELNKKNEAKIIGFISKNKVIKSSFSINVIFHS